MERVRGGKNEDKEEGNGGNRREYTVRGQQIESEKGNNTEGVGSEWNRTMKMM
jgi:hypothetical protein